MVNKKELRIGRKIEMEHTKSKHVAERIAKDHLKEYPNYYTKGVLPMEKKLEMLKRKNKYGKTRCQINKIISNVPDFEKQAKDFTKIELKRRIK